jgi:hypothetical protein
MEDACSLNFTKVWYIFLFNNEKHEGKQNTGSCMFVYEGCLQSLWTGGALWRYGNGIFFEYGESMNFSNSPRSCSTILKGVLLK